MAKSSEYGDQEPIGQVLSPPNHIVEVPEQAGGSKSPFASRELNLSGLPGPFGSRCSGPTLRDRSSVVESP